MQKILKYLLPAGLSVMILVAFTAPTFAVYNDVFFSADADFYLSGSGETITVVQGTTVESVKAEATSSSNFQIVLLANSTATLRSSNRSLLVNDGGTGAVINTVCFSSYSEVSFSGNLGTVLVTPAGTCPAPGGGGGGAPPPPPADPDTGDVTASGEASVAPASGGTATATTSEGATAAVTVPANAVSVTTTFSVAPTDTATATANKPAPSGKQIVGANVYEYTATVGSVAVVTFDEALTITMTYTDAQISGLDETGLQIHYYDEATSAWVALPTTIDAATNTLTASTLHFTLFAILAIVPTEGEEAVSLVDTSGTALVDGDLLSTADSFDIYIASFVGDKRFKRLILNPTIFESYGHLDWGNVKEVSQVVQDEFTLSDLVIEVNADGSVADEKVYKVSSALDSDVGQKQWLNMTAAQFELEGYDWDALANINHIEAGADFYPEGTALTSSL